MSYRLEKKYIINPKKSETFIKDLVQAGAKKIYKKRKIFSTYYDNDHLTSYRNSEEGIVPRKKIRIRSYDTDKHSEKSKLEFKISSEINRFKKTKNFKNKSEFINISRKGYLDKFYGYCKPKINVTYEREYFLLNHTRVTLDKNIIYLGYIKRDEILSQYLKSHFVILPSLIESFGLPIIEGIKSGSKILVSNIDSLKEICIPSISFNPTITKDIVSAFEMAGSFSYQKDSILTIKNEINNFINLINYDV